MSKLQRDKGARGEREAVHKLRRIFPRAGRKIANQAGVENGVDLVNTGRLRVQVKLQRKYASVTTLDAIEDTSGIPAVLTRADGCEWRVIMRLDDLLDILEDVVVAYE
jgi:hypothetical protein